MELISKLKNKLGLSIDQKLVDEALPFLEIRHIFVHADGKPNREFLQKNPSIELDSHKRIMLNSVFAYKAYNAVNNLLEAIDSEMIRLNYFSSSEM